MEQYLKASEVSSLLNINLIHIYRLHREGQLAAIRIGKRGLRFSESEVERWIKSQNKGREVSTPAAGMRA